MEEQEGRIARLKKKTAVTALLFGIALIGGAAGLLGNIDKILQVLGDWRTEPRIVGFKLSDKAAGYVETRAPFDDPKQPTVRTFNFQFPTDFLRSSHSALVFLVTVNNPTKHDLILNRAIYDVTELSGAKAGRAGPAPSLALYRYRITYEVGKQVDELVPPFVLPSEETASFELQVTAAGFEPDLAWLLRFGFETNQKTLYTEQVAIWLDGGDEPTSVKEACWGMPSECLDDGVENNIPPPELAYKWREIEYRAYRARRYHKLDVHNP